MIYPLMECLGAKIFKIPSKDFSKYKVPQTVNIVKV